MRKEYRRALRELMPRAIALTLPQFVVTHEPSRFIWPGELVFRWQPRAELRMYVVISPDPKAQHDAFWVSLAWSRLNRFPHLTMRPAGRPTPTGAELSHAEYEVRLNELCEPRREWWSVRTSFEPGSLECAQELIRPLSNTEAQSAITPLVDDAVKHLVAVAVPYLERLQRHALGSPQ